MASLKAPGVFVDEVINPSNALVGPALSAGAFLAPNARGPVVPTLVTSWQAFVALFGGFTSPTLYLPWAVHAFFSNGGRQCWVCRVTGTGAVVGTRTLLDRAGTPVSTLVINALNAGLWGNSVYIDIVDSSTTTFNLIVHYGGAGDAYVVERWLDLSMDPTNARYAPSVINSLTSGSNFISVADSLSATAAPLNRPASQLGTVLASGADGSAPTPTQMQTAVPLFDQVDGAFGIAMPGTFDAATVNILVAYAVARGDVFVVTSTDQNLTSAQAVTAATAFTASSFVACYYPWVYVSDPSSSTPGAMKKIPPGGAVLGQMAATDSVRGVWKAPAGTANRIAGSLALEARLTQADLEALHAGQVNAIRQTPGYGIIIFGARTLKTAAVDKYINVRRTLIYVERALKDGLQWAAFEPNDAPLWSAIKTQVDKFLLALWQAGGLKGASAPQAFYVKCDADNNPPPGVPGGQVTIEVGLAVQTPAEFVVIKVGQWDGGSYATEVPAITSA